MQSKLLEQGLGGTHRRTRLSSQQVVWAPEVLPELLLFHEKNPLNLHATQSQLGGLVGGAGGWTGGAGGRQGKKNQMESCLSGDYLRP